MKKYTDIYLLRHSKPDVPDLTFYGQSDVDVTENEFHKTVSRTKEKMDTSQVETVFSSPLKRCSSLARAIWTDHNNFITDKRVMELDFGNWELKHLNDIEPENMEAWTNDFLNARVHGGESHLDLYNRVCNFWEELIKRPDNSMVVVTHGGVIRSLLSRVLQMPLKKGYSLKVHYSELILVRYFGNEQYEVEFLTAPEWGPEPYSLQTRKTQN